MNTILLFLLVAFGMTDSGTVSDVLNPPAKEEAGYQLPYPNREAKPADLQNQVFQLKSVYSQFSVAPMNMEVSMQDQPRETLHLELRILGKPREELSNQEIIQIREAIYKAVGKRFNLEITTRVIPKEADIVGAISKIDSTNRQVLIVNTDNCRDEACVNTEKCWVNFVNDVVIRHGERDAKFEDLKLGDWLNVWSTGAVEQSLPGRATALEIEIAEPQDTTPKSLATLMGTDFKDIKQIDIRFGDGKKLVITDNAMIADISSKLLNIELIPSRDQRTVLGFLFSMELSVGDRKVKYGNPLWIDGVKYQQTVLTEELNKDIVKYGRANLPNLLPGIK
ncbi:hypothetical protein BC351_20280 [Paenibacillus ferrarius]|uniref:Uncharacterized protein n=1 Tax=Paenibacillus ferrarius TaxID=1469647 RepID=A0A1V4HNI1_9BACL|nr:hypothetical protein [Paenibacillus ferrarius]OPH59258.1 hypothetical protein BC351_20280 [Paenibacillus ferrarius]